MLRWTITAALGAFALSASAAPGHAPEKIVVRQDFAKGLNCVGLCLDHELTVRSDGTAILRMRPPESVVWHELRYQISPSEFAAFRDALAKVRPQGRLGPIGNCNNPQDEMRIPGKPDIIIRWRTAGRSDELSACSVDEVLDAVAAGYRALRIDIAGGERLSAADLGD